MYAVESFSTLNAPSKMLFERSEKTWKNVGKCRKKVGGLLGIYILKMFVPYMCYDMIVLIL